MNKTHHSRNPSIAEPPIRKYERGRRNVRNGAGDRIRTGDINLGKVALYQLSYSRAREGERSLLSRAARRTVKLHARPVVARTGTPDGPRRYLMFTLIPRAYPNHFKRIVFHINLSKQGSKK
jgi:hypothetical protein